MSRSSAYAISIARLYDSGATIAQIAKHLGTSPEGVRRTMIAAGIPRRPRGQPPGKFLPSGGRIRDGDGYVLIKSNDHPLANSGGYVREHRLVMEQTLGRFLLLDEVVHHLNGFKDDNRPENLRLYASNSALKQAQMQGNHWALGDTDNPKRRVRRRRTADQMLYEVAVLRARLNRDIHRVDLQPPWPSHRALGRAFGSWREGVRAALAQYPTATRALEVGSFWNGRRTHIPEDHAA